MQDIQKTAVFYASKSVRAKGVDFRAFSHRFSVPPSLSHRLSLGEVNLDWSTSVQADHTVLKNATKCLFGAFQSHFFVLSSRARAIKKEIIFTVVTVVAPPFYIILTPSYTILTAIITSIIICARFLVSAVTVFVVCSTDFCVGVAHFRGASAQI